LTYFESRFGGSVFTPTKANGSSFHFLTSDRS
jgi:hypothetical protein